MRKFRISPIHGLTLTAAAMSALLLGGCPTAQTPRTPADNSNTNSSTSTANQNSGTDLNDSRPIPPVNTDTSTSTSNTNSGGGSGGGSNGNTSGGGTGSVFVTVTSPTNTVRARPGAIVNLGFELTNAAGALQTTELVIARDNDGDARADGEPVFAKVLGGVNNGANTIPFNTNEIVGLLQNSFGRFVIGVRTTTITNDKRAVYSTGGMTLDAIPPTGIWTTPVDDVLVDRNQNWTVQVRTSDNAPHTVRILLDPDDNPESGNEFEYVPATALAAGDAVRTFSNSLQLFPANTYNYYVIVSDGIAPDVAFYAPNTVTGGNVQIATTNRMIGDLSLNTLTNSNNGGILQGFNFNDLAGSAISRVGDLNNDGRSEMLIASRFGKPALIQNNGVGFGEAYMLYGSAQRIRGVSELNSVGRSIPGLIFSGIRTPRNASPNQNESTRWTKGLSDITAVPDMDGDARPELVFSFPRAESINLGEVAPTIQHPELAPDLGGMGNLEYQAFYGNPPSWHEDESQFTRGGVVIVSSHNEMLRDPALLSRKADRVFDLHEAGQLFSGMGRPNLSAFIRQAITRDSPILQDRAAPFEVCADCDFQPPEGWSEGEIQGREDGQHGNRDCFDATGQPCEGAECNGQTGWPCAPNDPRDGFPIDPQDQEDTPGECGDDGCGFPAGPPPPTNPYTGNIHDGREATAQRWVMKWDVTFNDSQGPGGFHQPWTIPPADPPLANPSSFRYSPLLEGFPIAAYPNVWYPNFCGTGCEITNEWYSWGPTLPCTTLQGVPSWATGGEPLQIPLTDCYPNNPPGPFIVDPEFPGCLPEPTELCPPPAISVAADPVSAWTGFYTGGGPNVQALVGTSTGESFPTPIGARVLGQKLNDEFGSTIGADGVWLYISAPNHTVNDDPYTSDVPSLGGPRAAAGTVYQLRTNAALVPGQTTRTQLWLERGTRTIDPPNPGDPPIVIPLTWPNIDAEDVNRTDYTMPVPHNYIIESIGSMRGNPAIGVIDTVFGNPDGGGNDCPPGYDPGIDGPQASACGGYFPYPVGTAGYYMDRTPQIVGPHDDAKLSFVRALDDVNDDAIPDFAVGSEAIKQDVVAGTGPEVGGVFVVFSRTLSEQQAGDYLLEELALDVSNPNRLRGVLLKGASAGEKLGRVFDKAGDFNGDGIADVIVGNEGANGNAGEAIVLLGSRTLLSPGNGWTPAEAVAAQRAIRIVGVNAGDLVGANVGAAGDVDGDGNGDVLVAAPGAQGGRGVVYLIYGSSRYNYDQPGFTGTLNLAQIGTIGFQGARLIGRNVGDFVGAGAKTINNTDPSGGSTTATSRGITSLGDVDGDGRDDFAIGAMLASPNGRTNGGEVYVLYGRGD